MAGEILRPFIQLMSNLGFHLLEGFCGSFHALFGVEGIDHLARDFCQLKQG